jgi:hypothetical protein
MAFEDIKFRPRPFRVFECGAMDGTVGKPFLKCGAFHLTEWGTTEASDPLGRYALDLLRLLITAAHAVIHVQRVAVRLLGRRPSDGDTVIRDSV